MIDLLETQPEVREAQRVLLRRGASTTDQIAADLGVDAAAAAERLQWLADRGFAELRAEAGGPDRWHSTLRSRARQLSPRMRDVLDSL
jgi:predicted ArsR family transcriptional regulator